MLQGAGEGKVRKIMHLWPICNYRPYQKLFNLCLVLHLPLLTTSPARFSMDYPKKEVKNVAKHLRIRSFNVWIGLCFCSLSFGTAEK